MEPPARLETQDQWANFVSTAAIRVTRFCWDLWFTFVRVGELLEALKAGKVKILLEKKDQIVLTWADQQ